MSASNESPDRPVVSLRAALLASLPTWLWSRVAVAIVSIAVAWGLVDRAGDVPSFRLLWNRWDVPLIWSVGERGYFSEAIGPHLEVVFPGMPLLLRAVHFVVRDWVFAGLLISFVAGIVTCACLWWLATDELGPDGGDRAVLYLVLAPTAVFLFAGYSEMAWLAFATASWVAGRRGRWAYAGLLGIGAGLFRVTGVFFALGLVVEYLTAGRAQRGGRLLGRDAAWLVLPFAATASYIVWLYGKTGDWKAYLHAQNRGWDRELVPPWEGLERTYRAAVHPNLTGAEAWQNRGEILAMLVGVVLVVTLLVMRRWGESTYVGVSVLVLSTSSHWASTARAMLLWWPLYVLLARLTRGRQWLHWAMVWISAPLMAGAVITFTSDRWAG